MLEITADFDGFLKQLNDVERRQVPFAISLTLNETIDDVESNTRKRLPRVLDRPTPFTQRGLMTRKATKRRLLASVGFKRIQSAYLKFQEDGGERRPRRRAIPIPVGQRLNKYGNMPRAAIKRLLARPGVFSGEVRGVAGIWQRKRTRGQRGLKLLIAFKPRATYQPRLKFHEGALKTTRARIGINWRRSFARALKTARR